MSSNEPSSEPGSEQDDGRAVPRLETLEVSGPPSHEHPDYPTGFKFKAIMGALASLAFLTGLDYSIVSTAIPSITNHFKTVADIGCLYSIKKVFMVALGIFEAGSLVCAIAPTSKTLVFGRALAGLGCAGILSGGFTIIVQTVPVRRRSIYGGFAAAIEELAAVGAPMLGGVLTDRLSWRACFYLNLPLGIIALVVIWIFFEDPHVNRDIHLPTFEKLKKMDLLGTLLFVSGTTCLLLALQWGGSQYAWDNARVITLLVLCASLILLFAYWQYRQQDAAAIPPRIIAQRSILLGALFSGLNNAALTVVENYMSIYFQGVQGVSATKSGILLVPVIVGLLMAVILSGLGTSIVGYYTPFMIFTSVVAPVAAGLLTTITVTRKVAVLLCYEALLGFAVGIGIQAPQIAASTIFSAREAPMAISVVQFGQGIGPAIFISVAQSIFTERLSTDMAQYAPGTNSTTIQDMGLRDLRNHIGPKRLEKVLLGYDKAIMQTLYLPVALTALSLVATLGMEWRSVKRTSQAHS